MPMERRMQDPEQGKYGLWYADGVGFATKEEYPELSV